MEREQLPNELLTALTIFDDESENIVKPIVEKVEAQQLPDTIYHYTNDSGLNGILESGQFWLSDIFHLNDPSELSHGLSHAVKILNAKAESGPPESRVFAKHFRNFHELGLPNTAHYFACSFSSDGDDLGQWRAYADNGRGYSVGFDAKALEQAFTNENGAPIPNNCTFHVTYNDIELADIHRRLVDAMFGLISRPRSGNFSNDSIHAYMRELSISLSLPVLRTALFFKHEAYQHEQEYRFLQIFPANEKPPSMKRRFRSFELVKYREFDWRNIQPGALTRIMIGPAADNSKALRFASDCLSAFHTGQVEIAQSQIPYRAV